ncbi:hypothetical protein SISSUDRAFT_1041513, partial [Sistotremastrum suecicum HHB10207 ss-3]
MERVRVPTPLKRRSSESPPASRRVHVTNPVNVLPCYVLHCLNPLVQFPFMEWLFVYDVLSGPELPGAMWTVLSFAWLPSIDQRVGRMVLVTLELSIEPLATTLIQLYSLNKHDRFKATALGSLDNFRHELDTRLSFIPPMLGERPVHACISRHQTSRCP